jgi:hypothetical protein
MKKTVLFFCMIIAVAVHAQKEKAEAYVNRYKEVAITEMLRSGVPASITLAQGILESQYGESDLVKSSNNHFGIKCKTEWTGPKVYHDDDEKGECFRVYATAEDSYKDHSDFLKTRPHYAFLFQLDPTDFEGWAKGLKKAGYATSPIYPQSLLKVISDYNLQQYTLLALARQKSNGTVPENSTIQAGPKPGIQEEKENKPEVKEVAAQEKESKQTEAPVTPVAKVKQTARYPQGVFTINHTKVIYGSEGTSLLSLAIQYEIPLSKLLEYNELPEMDVLDIDRLIFVEKKSKKGASDFHLAVAGETLHDISQQEGVRLESILEYNNLKKGTVASPGDKIYLRTVTAAAALTKPSRSPK